MKPDVANAWTVPAVAAHSERNALGDLLALPYDAVLALARHHEALAQRFRIRVAEIERRDAMRHRSEKRLATFRDAVDVFAAYLADGTPYERALQAARTATGAPEATIEANFKRKCQDGDRRALAARDIAAMRMMRAGAGNKEISERLGVHRNTVSRIKNRALGQHR